MDQLILWFNMLTFALMVAAAGLVYLVYLRSQHRWLRSFVVYTGTYAGWLLFGTYVFFQAVFLPQPIPSLTAIFVYVRVGFSLPILTAGSVFYLRIAAGEGRWRGTTVVVAIVVVIGVLVAAFLGWSIAWAGTASTMIFNGYFAALSIYSLTRITRTRDARRRMLGFLIFSAVAYTLLVATSLALLFVPPSAYQGIPVNVFASGTFCAGWGLLMVLTASRWMMLGRETPSDALPALFVEDHGISRRESEIIEALREGLTSRQIGERLFISQRTVETHVQNIYRKCGVNNRVELINEISRYLKT